MNTNLIIYVLVVIGVVIAFIVATIKYKNSQKQEKIQEKTKNELINIKNETINNKKEIEALKIIVQNSNRNSFNLEEETGFTKEQLVIIAKNALKTSNSYFDKGNAYFYLNDFKNAILQFSKTIELNPYNPDAYSHRAMASFQALHNLKRDELFVGDRFLMSEELGEVYKKKLEEIIEDSNKSIKLNPKLNTFYNRAVTYISLKSHNNAISDIKQVIKLNPNDDGAYDLLGIVYSDLGLIHNDNTYFEKAIIEFNKAIKINPNNALYYSNIGLVYSRMKNYKDDLIYYNKAISLNPNLKGVYQSRGATYKLLDKCDLAISDFTKEIELNNNLILSSYSSRLDCYLKQKKWELAIKDISYLIENNKNTELYKNDELNFNLSSMYYQRGGTYLVLKKYYLAISDLSKVIQLNDEFVFKSYINRAICYSNQEEYEKAIKDYNYIIENLENSNIDSSTHYTFYTDRGNKYLKLRKYKEAIIDYEKAISLNPDDYKANKNKKIALKELKR